MDCRECGGSIAIYRLAGETAAVCEGCGRVGIEADHSGRSLEKESWTEALRRFRRQSSAAGASSSADGDDADD